MKSLRAIAILNLAGPSLAACMLVVPLAAAEASEPLNSYTETKLTAADGKAYDLFGSAVAISGETAVIGASGLGYVFERDPLDPAIWNQIAKLVPSEPVPSEGSFRFGTWVAISGDTALIGAYVFERDPLDPAIWNQTAKLVPSDGAEGFGFSVAISGDTVCIGAYGDDDLGYRSGSAYVFERDPLNPAIWIQTAKLTASDGGTYAYFGAYVAIATDIAVIGAYGHDSAYVFERDPLDPAIWTEAAKLTAFDGSLVAYFGASVAIAGETALIGASGVDGYSGAAYVFERDPVDPAAWTQTAKVIASDRQGHQLFGSSAAISGDTAVIGAPGDGYIFGYPGSAYVFERDPLNPANWIQTAKLTPSDGLNHDRFGAAVAISGETAVIGAYYDDAPGADSGSAYVYAPLVCELELALQPRTFGAGDELRVAVDLHHRRPVTVTVPFLLWIEDAAGQVMAQKSSPPITMEPGDHRQLRMAVTLPPSLPPGAYRVVVGVRRMQQGIAWASRQFEIVE